MLTINRKLIARYLLLLTVGVLTFSGSALGQSPIEYEDQILLQSDAVFDRDYWFGFSVAVDGDNALIGKYGDAYGDRGSVYVFSRIETGEWIEQEKLEASDGARGDHFGYSVALEGNSALIGSPDDDNERGEGAGSIYIFTCSDQGEWTEKEKLLASDGTGGDRFGITVTVNHEVAVIGAPGARAGGVAYVFSKHFTGAWNEDAILIPPDAGAARAFGAAISLDDDTVIVGDPWADYNGNGSGAAFTFIRDSSGDWEFQDVLLPSDLESYDNFGDSVTIDGDVLMVGAAGHDGLGEYSDSGAVYVFDRNESGVWREGQKLTSSDIEEEDRFGDAVALMGNVAVIGAYEKDLAGVNTGAAYVFIENDEGVWIEASRLHASDPAAWDELGTSIALGGDAAFLSAYGKIIYPYYHNGAAYVFDMSPFLGPVDIAIDFMPGNSSNPINPRQRGRFWLAVLSDTDFDALRVDPASVRLGARGASPDSYLARDSNYDGMADLLVRFRTPSVGIVCGDTSIEITGETYDGVEIVGEDDLRTVGCKKPKPKKKGKKK